MNHSTNQIARPVQPQIVDKIGFRFQRFAHIEGISGILLVAATILALVWANSPWSNTYFDILNTHFSVGLAGQVTIDESLVLWINDALMAIFFFVVGLELKREVAIGELSSFRKAILPALAAVGGMLIPVLIFLGFNHNNPAAMEGWAIPMATDIAFAIGVLALVGKRAPLSLSVFLTALAIVDDIGAILVIAIFYTAQINFVMLFVGVALVALLFLYAKLGGRWLVVYGALGLLTWLAIYLSGLHATLAGVLVALTIPVRTKVDTKSFSEWMRQLIDWFDSESPEQANGKCVPTSVQRTALFEMTRAIEHADSPLHRLEHILHPWVAFLIMPIFALSNAGIIINTELLGALLAPLALGIILGLVLGKPIGIFGATWLGVKLKLGSLPKGVTWRHILGAGILAGMGFTMSIFITTLAFSTGGGHAELLGFKLASPALLANADMEDVQNLAKLAILAASTIAGIAGYLLLRTAPQVDIKEARVTPPERE
jgi:NhaA family Na+:H+ antiporter